MRSVRPTDQRKYASRLIRGITAPSAFKDAEALLLARFKKVTLAQLSADFHARLIASGTSIDLENMHDT